MIFPAPPPDDPPDEPPTAPLSTCSSTEPSTDLSWVVEGAAPFDIMREASHDSTMGARIGNSFLIRPDEAPVLPSWLTTCSWLSPKMCAAIFSPSAALTRD